MADPSVTDRGTATLRFSAEHPAAAGHFPGNPIIPGAVLLRDIAAAVGNGNAGNCQTIRAAKFHRPVRPGDALVLSWTNQPRGEVRFSCSIDGVPGAVVTGTLVLARS